ncbi:hypothetical protein [Acidianus manzaensis]|uniref:Uncharacterized protein n=1 Tax=Acidianus manzaensis TaxID=282676 RepID=A0A1W6K0X7_9CREN|nr:hypothetical protein [Acidianus manzaensis]ARM76183.1 hypothetical protein B6F84_09225 [Acidianus manzaensis]
MNKLLTIVFLIPLMLMPLALAGTNGNTNTYYADYTITYTTSANLQASHNMSSLKGSFEANSNLNINISSTPISNGKFNDSVLLNGYMYYTLNILTSGLTISNTHNTSINDKISFISNYSIQNVTNILSIINMFNISFSKSGNITYNNITILYNVNLEKIGTVTVTLNNTKYTGYVYSISGNVTSMTTTMSKFSLNTMKNINGKIISLNNGLIYSANISGNGHTIIGSNHFSMSGKSTSLLTIKLLSTNIGAKSIGSFIQITTKSVNNSATQKTSNTTISNIKTTPTNLTTIKPSSASSLNLKDILLPAGIIVAIAVAIVLIRKLF